jgi:hypothetical protein
MCTAHTLVSNLISFCYLKVHCQQWPTDSPSCGCQEVKVVDQPPKTPPNPIHTDPTPILLSAQLARPIMEMTASMQVSLLDILAEAPEERRQRAAHVV